MALSGSPRPPRTARPKISLKMQAIGFLSRREHSRQELRAKLLASLRKREREEAALAAAVEAHAKEVARALSELPSNGIDDAFAPPVPSGPAASNRDSGRPPRSATPEPRPSAALDAVRLASGDPLPHRLRSRLVVQQASCDVDRSTGDPSSEPLADPDFEREDPEAAVDQLLDWLVANKYLSESRFVESRVNARARKQGALMIKLELSRHGLVLEPDQAAALRETEFARAQALWQRKFGELATDARTRAKQARFLAARGFASDVVRRIVGGEEEF